MIKINEEVYDHGGVDIRYHPVRDDVSYEWYARVCDDYGKPIIDISYCALRRMYEHIEDITDIMEESLKDEEPQEEFA